MLLTAGTGGVMCSHATLRYNLPALVAKVSLTSEAVQMVVALEFRNLRATTRAITHVDVTVGADELIVCKSIGLDGVSRRKLPPCRVKLCIPTSDLLGVEQAALVFSKVVILDVATATFPTKIR